MANAEIRLHAIWPSSVIFCSSSCLLAATRIVLARSCSMTSPLPATARPAQCRFRESHTALRCGAVWLLQRLWPFSGPDKVLA